MGKGAEEKVIPTKSTTTTTRTAPDWIRDYVEGTLSRQQNVDQLSDWGNKWFYGGGINDLYGFTDDDIAGRDYLRNFATDPNGILAQTQQRYGDFASGLGNFEGSAPGVMGQTAYNTLDDLASGKYLSGDLYDRMFNARVDKARQAIASMFSGGSGLAQANLGYEVGRADNEVLGQRLAEMQNAAQYMGNYGQNLAQMQMNAGDQAVKYGTLEGALLKGLGEEQRANNAFIQNAWNNQINQDYQRNFPFINPQNYMTTVSDTEGEQTVYSNPGAGLFGGILSGLGLMSGIGGNGGLSNIFSNFWSGE